MSEKLKPCYFCEYDAPLLHSCGTHVFIECISCGHTTGAYENEEDAIQEWGLSQLLDEQSQIKAIT